MVKMEISEINHTKSDQPVENLTPPTKKKRSLPGMPDPDSEVIALSPKTLLATNRFVCEICNKGFQRDQNLQLHRRGHNLPWKLRQRTDKEMRKRVYVCPEPTCIHHDPSRALGDLTGIKKHFCRKHGEKKYKCDRCSKNYAVQSDWKAHMKTCGTKEYRCDCGTVFSRRDSFITHKAFCEALAQESAALSQPPAKVMSSGGDLEVWIGPQTPAAASSPPPPPLTPPTGVLSPVLSVQSSAELSENQTAPLPPPPRTTTTNAAAHSSTASTVFASIFNPSNCTELTQSSHYHASSYNDSLLCPMNGRDRPAIDPISLSLSSSLYSTSSLFPSTSQNNPQPHYLSSPQPALSATALLQKAAQMGATSSNPSFLCGLWFPVSSSLNPHQDIVSTMAQTTTSTTPHGVKLEKNSMASTLGLGLPSTGASGFGNELVMSSSTLYGDKPTTLDFLGLGMGGGGEASSGGFSAFLSSIGGGLDMTAATFTEVRPNGDAWDDPSERKPSFL
ncbi:protein indeterminate-domain 2 [Phtheirospermum japonicum]|uniref:Protein indeterminate-domain 2 n=1 Tax=Phtheirospermum japonicum TaxID=374723 RepID=A0A830CQI4_9LAMI|nr:protein indeterminate-domain 2 [Phtheirospermum japonicum]